MTATPFASHSLRLTVTYLGADETVTASVTLKPFTRIPEPVMAITEPDDRIWAMFEWALSAEDFAVIEQLDADELDRVLREWARSGTDDIQRFLRTATNQNPYRKGPVHGC